MLSNVLGHFSPLFSYVGDAILNTTRDVVEFLGVPQSVIEAVEILTGVDLNKVHVPYAQSTYAATQSSSYKLKAVVNGNNTKPLPALQCDTPLFSSNSPQQLAPSQTYKLPAFCSLETLEKITNFPTYLSAQLEGYQVESRVGKGATSSVYLATNCLGERVAIKVYHTDPKYADLNEQEFAAYQNPGFIRARERGVLENGLRYLVMDYSESGDALAQSERLRSIRDSGSPNSAQRAREYLKKLSLSFANDLVRAHEAGVIHGDVKPENYFPGLGLGDGASSITNNHEQTTIVGSPYYMAPELRYALTADGLVRFRGTRQGWVPECIVDEVGDDLHCPENYMSAPDEFGNRYRLINKLSDQYALGLSILEILLGDNQLPTIDLSNPDSYISSVADLIVIAGYPIEVANVLLKATAENPNDRYPSAHDFYNALNCSFEDSQVQNLLLTDSSGEGSGVRRKTPELDAAIQATSYDPDAPVLDLDMAG